MALGKQEFYEGAAIYLLARNGGIKAIRYEAPFFLFNDKLFVLMKYSAKKRSPWSFTFSAEEQRQLEAKAATDDTAIALICGSDGVATCQYDEYRCIADLKTSSIHIACYRDFGEHYSLNGPDGTLRWKVAPSRWRRILES